MEWTICLDFFHLLFFFDLRSTRLLFEELFSNAAHELQGTFWAAMWSFIIFHYIFLLLQGGSFETFLADLWMQNVTGTC